MNRRSFLSSAAGAGAVAALPFAAVTKVHSQSSGPNPSFLTLVNSAIAVQGIAVVKLLNGKSSASDWTNSANALMAVYNSYMANNVDGQLASAFQKLNTGEITLANLATQSLAQAILTYMPSFPVSGWYSLMQAASPSFEPYIPVVLAYIQEYGFADFIALEAEVYQAIGRGNGGCDCVSEPQPRCSAGSSSYAAGRQDGAC